MGFRRRHRILSAGKSPSRMAMERTYNRALLNGGVTQDFSANVENIREISRKLGYNILKTPVQRNLAQFSEDFTNAIWLKDNRVSITANTNLNPFGVNKSYYLQETAVLGNHYLHQTFQLTISQIWTASFYVKKAQDTWIQLANSAAYFTSNNWINFNFDTGLFGNSGGVGSFTKTDLGGGWWKLTVTGTVAVSNVAGDVGVILGTNNTNSATVGLSYLGVVSHNICDVAAIQCELNSFTTNYQYTQNAPMDGDFTNANFLYVPASYGESKNFAQVQNKRNLLVRTEEFDNAVWVKNASTVTVDVTTAPNGTLTADKLVETVTASTHSVNQTFVPTTGIYTFSIYVKSAERTFFRLADGNVTFVAIFDLTTISVVSSATAAKIEVVGNGWRRCSVIVNATTSSNTFHLQAMLNSSTFNYTGTAGSGLYIWGAQLELGAYATPYQKTVAAGDGIVDFNFTRATSATVTNKLGVIEDSCYNLIQQSEEFDNAYWQKSNTTVSANTVISPNGTLTADTLLETTSNTTHYFSPLSGVLVSNNTTYTFSAYVKYNGRQWIVLNIGDTVNNSTYFDIQNGIIGSSTNGSISPTITNLSNGWYRCSITRIVTTTTIYPAVQPAISDGNYIYTGDITKGLYVWGAQLTQGSTPRPYLRTTNRLNVPRLDYSRNVIRRNLLNYSEELNNPYWNRVSASIIGNQITAPNGTVTADKLVEGNDNNVHTILNNAINLSVGSTGSIYIKAEERTWVLVLIGDGVAFQGFYVNLSNGAIGSFFGGAPSSYSVQNVGNGWYRVILSTTIVGNMELRPYTSTGDNGAVYIGDGTSGIYVWGAQLETGSIATEYQYTTTTNFPEPELLIEVGATNLVTQSETYGSSPWLSFGGATVASDVATAPNGLLSADKVIVGGTNTNFTRYQQTASPLAIGTYTYSVYVKKADYNYVAVGISDNSTVTKNVKLNFTTNAITADAPSGIFTAVSGNVQILPNGWYRLSITTTCSTAIRYRTDSTVLDNSGNIVFAGNGTSGTYFWGDQLETGSNATTYIPTTTASVTRNTETNYTDLWNNSVLSNSSNWTLFWEGYLYDGQTTGMSVCLSDTTTAASNTNQIGWLGGIQPFYNIGNTRTNTPSSAVSNNTYNKFAIQYNNGTVNFYRNGTNIWSNQTVAVFDYRYLVLSSGGSTFTTDKIALFNRTLTSTECTLITT